MAFDHSSLRWFEACSCKPAPRGPPSSSAQLLGTLCRCNHKNLRSSKIRNNFLNNNSEPGRPEEFHLQSPSDPYVNLSIHTAPASHSLEISRSQAYAKRTRLLPRLAGLTIAFRELAHPLRSSPITGPSTLLRDDPPPSCASILSPFVDLTYRVFS